MNEIIINVVNQFLINGEVIDIREYGEGHINNTYLVTTNKCRYILQRINNTIFPNVAQLMSNIYLVTNHIKKNYPNKETLTLINTNTGNYYYQDKTGYYRLYKFIEHTICLQVIENKEEFYECAKAFGEFTKMLATFDATKLYEVIPNFHNTESRYNDFISIVDNDINNKVQEVKEEIEFVNQRKDFCKIIVKLLQEKKMPLKVTHNDTKLNNILLDEKAYTGKAVIDLDTIMPGSICYDFGDSIRFGCNSTKEDEQDISKVFFRIDLFEVYTKGYLETLGNTITVCEKDNLASAAILLTLECGMRFLSDYLNGNTYFKTNYPKHNLVRCHTQFKLVCDMEKQLDQMKKIVNKYYKLYCV